jgi:hypothetical protein
MDSAQSHADNHPSWRWDAAKRRAVCTCMKSHSIFDVVCKMKEVTFEAAKIIVAEMIGRADLIRLTRGKGGERGRFPPDIDATLQHLAGCTVSAYATAKHLSVEALRSFGISESYYLSKPAVRILYYSADGTEAAVRFRIALDGKDKFRWRKRDKARLYGLDRVQRLVGDFVAKVDPLRRPGRRFRRS